MSYDEAFGTEIDYTDPVVRRERLLSALMEGAARKPRPGRKTVSLSAALVGIDPEQTGEDPNPKKSDLNDLARKWLKKAGYQSFRVDYFDARFNRSHDLLGIFDYLAFAEGTTVGVQITSANSLSARRKKVLASPNLAIVKRAGWRVLLLGFYPESREGPNGGVKVEWL